MLTIFDEMDESFFENNKIPIRNVWFLFLYAYDLAKFRDRYDSEIEDSPNFKSLIARLLCHVVERRLRRRLSFGYQHQRANLTRVRGRIDVLKTKSFHLLQRGEIACRFEEQTINTPRNRLVRAALASLSESLDVKELVDRTRSIVGILDRAGVSGQIPSRAELVTDQIARHESEDKLMSSLAHAVFDLILPTERKGNRRLLRTQRDDVKFSNLFEKAIGNFYKTELSQNLDWEVKQSQPISWLYNQHSKNLTTFLPEMKTDITLMNNQQNRKIVIDTKFRDILEESRYGKKIFRSENIYQIYAYIRSQESPSDPYSQNAEGVLLYPTIEINTDEAVKFHGHIFRFVTIDLSEPTEKLIQRLRNLPFELPEFTA